MMTYDEAFCQELKQRWGWDIQPDAIIHNLAPAAISWEVFLPDPKDPRRFIHLYSHDSIPAMAYRGYIWVQDKTKDPDGLEFIANKPLTAPE